MHVGKRKEKNQDPAPPLQSIQRQEEPLFCAVSHTRSLIQTLIRMDGSSPPRDWKKAWNYLSREGSSPENCQNCRLDEQKIADDKFFNWIGGNSGTFWSALVLYSGLASLKGFQDIEGRGMPLGERLKARYKLCSQLRTAHSEASLQGCRAS